MIWAEGLDEHGRAVQQNDHNFGNGGQHYGSGGHHMGNGGHHKGNGGHHFENDHSFSNGGHHHHQNENQVRNGLAEVNQNRYSWKQILKWLYTFFKCFC